MKSNHAICCLLFHIIVCCICFACCVAESLNPEDAFHPYASLDHTPYGITMKLADFDGNKEQNEFLHSSSQNHGIKTTPGLLSPSLGEDGYPTNSEGLSLSGLLSDAAAVNRLFPSEPFQTHGFLEFDSTQCFASLQEDGSFALYQELSTVDDIGISLDHGQFLPFNDLTPGSFSTAHPINATDALNNELPDDDPRKGERLYGIPGNAANHYFGLEMEASFIYPSSGLDSYGQEITASFTADDDLWVYIDGMLILDLGGVHSAVPGEINFTTGRVTYRDADGNDYSVKLSKLFYNRYKAAHPEAKEKEIDAFVNAHFLENKNWQVVFKPDTVHTIRLFYFERGAGASNLHIKMNVPLMESATE